MEDPNNARRGTAKIGLMLAAGAAVPLIYSGWATTAHAATAASTLTVCSGGCDYTSIAAAVAAAGDGDTIKVSAGTYHGGFTIGKSLTLIGVGAENTIISGGGPVVTVGVPLAASEPTVTIRGFTITRGRTTSGFDGTFEALGGGILVAPASKLTLGATLTLDDSVVSSNRTGPTTTISSPHGAHCPGGPCPFAIAAGGGIDSWGTLTVLHSVIRNNESAGPVTSDADGGGIDVHEGTLVVDRSIVTENRARAVAPNGRFAEGAGIMADNFFAPAATIGSVTVRQSIVSDNVASLTSALPSFADAAMTQLIVLGANAAGIHVGESTPLTVDDTSINGNTVTATDLDGEPFGIDAGMIVGGGLLTMHNSSVTGNRDVLKAATTLDVGGSGSAVEADGPALIDHSIISGNDARVDTPTGIADANGALAILNSPQPATVRDTTIDDNTAEATSASGAAIAQGAGLFNNGVLLLEGVRIDGNEATATGPAGTGSSMTVCQSLAISCAQGGGIWNGVQFTGPPVELTLKDTTVSDNEVQGSNGVLLQGGGVFTTLPVTLVRSRITENEPDQCFGC